LYGKGLCFGMAVASLLYFADRMKDTHRPPIAEFSLTPALLDTLRMHHAQQYGPRTILATVWNWVASGGGCPKYVLDWLCLVGIDSDPHILCFGPALNRRFFSCFAQAHAVVPYRVEGTRVYVYDPNYPRDRGRFVEFWRGGAQFAYDGFRSREGWGIALVRGVVRGAPKVF
jgi:hypothetical protein